MLEVFENLIVYLENLGVKKENIIGFSDSSFKYVVDDLEGYNRYIKQSLIIETPAGIKADQCILAYSLKHDNVLIITNDLMREYYVSLPYDKWIVERRITVVVVKEEIFLIPMLGRIEKREMKIKSTLDVIETIKNSRGDFNLYQ